MSGVGAWLLAIDTATNTIVVAAGSTDGTVIASELFEGRYRHSQELLPAVNRVMASAGLRLADLAAIVVGTGPGAFTGLRVALATAKTLAHELDRPVIGVSTADALLAGAAGGGDSVGRTVLWLPSGPRDRVAVVAGRAPVIVRAGDSLEIEAGTEVAVDLEGRASDDALARGRGAIERMPETLLRVGAARLAAGERDDPERLVPQYASLPRGAPALEPEGGVAWSRDPR